MRQKYTINNDWKFLKKNVAITELMNETFEDVTLPHSWNALDGHTGGSNYHRDLCWYYKSLDVTKADGEKVFIEFEAANSVSNVYFNGVHLGEHRGGYSTFRYEITEHLAAENHLIVSVDNSHDETVYPLMADFTFSGGLYRSVNIIKVKASHFDLMDHGSRGVYVTQESVSKDEAVLTIKGLIVSEEPMTMGARLIDHEGNIVAEGGALGTGETEFKLTVKNPTLWNTTAPYMYDTQIALINGEEVMDYVTVKTGLRYYNFDAEKGLFLNGEHVKLKGVSRHQCYMDKGWAISEKEQIEDMLVIKDMGANSIRLAHYQHNQFFYDLCDKFGIVVWAEIPYISLTSKTDETGSNAISQMKELVKQNYNHPSIFMWGVQNEITIAGKVNNIEGIVNELNTLTKEMDPTRVTTQAQVGHCPDEDSLNKITDILAYNRYHGWYYDTVEDYAVWCDNFHKAYPEIPLGISEYGAEGILTYQNDDPKQSDYSETYHAHYHEVTLQAFSERQYIWGSYVWNMFDFYSDLRDEGGVKGRNNKGLVTLDRSTKKDAFYYYKATWSNESFVHITAKRFINRHKATMDVRVYTNLESATLYVNDQMIETKNSEKHIVTFKDVAVKDITKVRVESGVYIDEAAFRKVDKEDLSYVYVKEVTEGGDVTNWFDLDIDENLTEYIYNDGCYSMEDNMKDLYESDATRAVLNKYMPDFSAHPQFEMAQNFKLSLIMTMMPGEKMPDVVQVNLNNELSAISK